MVREGSSFYGFDVSSDEASGDSFPGKRFASSLDKGPERKQNSTKASIANMPGTKDALPFWKMIPPAPVSPIAWVPPPSPEDGPSPVVPATGRTCSSSVEDSSPFEEELDSAVPEAVLSSSFLFPVEDVEELPEVFVESLPAVDCFSWRWTVT